MYLQTLATRGAVSTATMTSLNDAQWEIRANTAIVWLESPSNPGRGICYRHSKQTYSESPAFHIPSTHQLAYIRLRYPCSSVANQLCVCLPSYLFIESASTSSFVIVVANSLSTVGHRHKRVHTDRHIRKRFTSTRGLPKFNSRQIGRPVAFK